MIAPNKYVSTQNSLLGQASVVLARRREGATVSAVWEDIRESGLDLSYERFILCLDFLFSVGIVDIEGGVLLWQN